MRVSRGREMNYLSDGFRIGFECKECSEGHQYYDGICDNKNCKCYKKIVITFRKRSSSITENLDLGFVIYLISIIAIVSVGILGIFVK